MTVTPAAGAVGQWAENLIGQLMARLDAAGREDDPERRGQLRQAPHFPAERPVTSRLISRRRSPSAAPGWTGLHHLLPWRAARPVIHAPIEIFRLLLTPR
jgi:hypothetical protein